MSFQSPAGEDQVNPDLQWLTRVVRLKSNAATQLAVHLLVQSKRSGGNKSFSISAELLRQERISRSSSHRALRLLEAARLVLIKRQRGASPVLTIKDVEALSDNTHWDDVDDDYDDDDDIVDDDTDDDDEKEAYYAG